MFVFFMISLAFLTVSCSVLFFRVDKQQIINEHTRFRIEKVECSSESVKPTCQTNYKHQIDSIETQRMFTLTIVFIGGVTALVGLVVLKGVRK